MPARRHTTLVDAAALGAALGDPAWVVLDCRSALGAPGEGARRYAAGHVPGAHFADLEQDLSDRVTPHTGRHPLPDPAYLGHRLGECGVEDGTQIVAYDDAGGVYAARLWWLARWLGHEAVAVLDGGWQAWLAAGGAASTAVPPLAARSFDVWLDDTAWLDAREVGDIAAGRAAGLLIDARAPARYAGREEPIDPVAGHVPGARNLPYAGNLGADGRFLPRESLRARFAALLDGRSPDEAVHYCGSGVTACHNVLAMEHAGLAGSRLYAGSWSEWIRDPSRPIAAGGDDT